VAVLADGRRVLSRSDDNTLRLWDLATGDCLANTMPMPQSAALPSLVTI
jgi:hypothetical protein